jgi:hypothetical protein
MNDTVLTKGYLVYQHINPITDDIFYIGSGKVGREKELGELQRGSLYNLYVKNNNLVSLGIRHRALNVDIKVLKYFNSKDEAMKYENELITLNYGKQGYKLVNTQTSFIHDSGMLDKRTAAVKHAIEKQVIHIETGTIYESVTVMAIAVDIKRSALQKRLKKIINYPSHRFSDNITPCYKG